MRDMIEKTGEFNISVLTQETPFKVFQHFGMQSGRDTDKFSGCETEARSANGLLYIPKYTNAYLSGRVEQSLDCGTHTLFIARVTEAKALSDAPSATYAYYFEHIKPKPAQAASAGKVWECKICGYTYDEAAEGVPFDALPDDWVCPLCRHPKSDFALRG